MTSKIHIPARESWYREAFQEDYLDVYPHRDLSEAARAVRFLSAALGLGGGETLLDLCCGPGRHLAFFRRYVRRAVGIDLSSVMLTRARAHVRAVAQAQTPAQPGATDDLRPMLLRADMRRLPLTAESVDCAVNLFTSFGYFENDADNAAVLAEVARLLRRGGCFAIDHINRATLLGALVARSERTLSDGRRVSETRSYDEAARRITKEVAIFLPESQPDEAPSDAWRESVRVYGAEEMESMLEAAGLQPLVRHGDYDGGPWHEHAPRLIILARRH